MTKNNGKETVWFILCFQVTDHHEEKSGQEVKLGT